MQLLNNKDLFEEFYELVKDDVDISFEQLKEVLYGPWRYLKDEIASGELDTIRFKYFGIFTVYPGKVKAHLKSNELRLSQGVLAKEDYERYNKVLKTYLDKHEKANKTD